MYVCMYVYLCVCIYIFPRYISLMYTCNRVCSWLHMLMCMYEDVYVCMYVWMAAAGRGEGGGGVKVLVIVREWQTDWLIDRQTDKDIDGYREWF